MRYAEIFNKANIVKNIPLVCQGRELPTGMNAVVVLTRVQYDKPMREFNEAMESVLKGLKKEGFDERNEKQNRLKEIDSRVEAVKNWKKGDKDKDGKPVDKPEMPTEEELKEVEEIRKDKEAYEVELKDLDAECGKAHLEKMKEDAGFKERKFSADQFEAVIKLIGVEGEIEVNGNQVPKSEFINVIGTLFVE